MDDSYRKHTNFNLHHSDRRFTVSGKLKLRIIEVENGYLIDCHESDHQNMMRSFDGYYVARNSEELCAIIKELADDESVPPTN